MIGANKMPGRKTVIIAVMVLIIIAVGLIFFISSRNTYDPEKRLEEAQNYYDMLDYDKAIAIYNEVLSSENSCAEAYIGLADSYMLKGNIEKAAEILERGLEATDHDVRIADKISELPEAYSAEITESETSVTVTDAPAETTVMTTSVTETETVTETTSVTTEQTEETTTETTVETTSATTTVTTTVTTVPTTAVTTVRQTQTTPKPTIKMPNFIGISKDEAFELAEKNNIMLIFEYENNDTYANNVVFHQSYRAGTMVSEQTPVYAYVCVNDKKLVTEEDKNVQDFYNAAKSWGSSNSDKVKSVDFDEDNSTVTINASSTKRLIIDESVIAAFEKCDNAFLCVSSADLYIVIYSASVTSSDKLNLSSEVFGNASKISVTIGSEGNLNCTLKVTLLNCEIRKKKLEEMYIYKNDKKFSPVEFNEYDEPVINMSNGGTYVIK
ncbi:MAG: tetratricopeptide repeat protein [Oscillospiraceae bacterium]